MLTKTDHDKLRRDFSKIFATKKDLMVLKFELKDDITNLRNELKNEFRGEINNFRVELKNDIIEFKDAILNEIVAMRQELTVVLGHRDMLEDHEVRISKLEKKTSKPN